MKKIIGAALILALALLLIPLGLRHSRQGEEAAEPETRSMPAETPLTLPDNGHLITVQFAEGDIRRLDLNQYLWGVVAAEMPAGFQEEALKAQAVAARTFTLHSRTKASHPDALVCTDYRCCQAWISREEAEANWGVDTAVSNGNRITTAVADTDSKVILYEGRLIDAVFHSSSGDTTLDAVAVWGNSVPYLQAVPSPEGEEVPKYQSSTTFTPEEFREKFLAARPEAVLEGDPATWFSEPIHDAGGSVASIDIGGVTVTGSQARAILNLRSPTFSVSVEGEAITFHVTGFGHGVGMSQYGANAMAREGSGYEEILLHYYTGVTVEDCPEDFYPVLPEEIPAPETEQVITEEPPSTEEPAEAQPAEGAQPVEETQPLSESQPEAEQAAPSTDGTENVL